MNEQQPQPIPPEHVPKASRSFLQKRLSYYSGVRTSPVGTPRTLDLSYRELDHELTSDYPNLDLRRLGMTAVFVHAENGGFIGPMDTLDDTGRQAINDGVHFHTLFTVGFGLIRDSYAAVKKPLPPDSEQALWFDRDDPLTISEFFDCLNIAQLSITEKYPALQLALQAFAKATTRKTIAPPSPRAPAIASVAASELYDAFSQMESARNG